MKSLIIISAFTGLITSSCTGQRIKQDKVPSVVVNTVKAKFPAANDVDWKKVKDQYEAEVETAGGTDVTMRIDASGKTLMVKEDMPVTELIPPISSLIREKYDGYTIDDAEKIQKDGVVFYQVDLDGRNKKDVKLVFAGDGAVAPTVTYWD